MQNTSHAVMAQRFEAEDSLDDFPTPPWATRALMEHIVASERDLRQQSCLEPACGAGHMAKVIAEYFGEVSASDIRDYNYSEVKDFLTTPFTADSFDWVITNPPFNRAEDFVLRALKIARKGVAILARTAFIESVSRYERLYSKYPCARFAPFTERVAMVKGRLDRKASTATSYSWFVWEKGYTGPTQVVWVPPCRKLLERDEDWEAPLSLIVTEVAPAAHERARVAKVQESLFEF